jgi:hypothetical protein
MKGKRDVYYNSGKARNLRVGKNVLNDFAIMTENLFVLVGQCRSRSDNFLSPISWYLALCQALLEISVFSGLPGILVKWAIPAID